MNWFSKHSGHFAQEASQLREVGIPVLHLFNTIQQVYSSDHHLVSVLALRGKKFRHV